MSERGTLSVGTENKRVMSCAISNSQLTLVHGAIVQHISSPAGHRIHVHNECRLPHKIAQTVKPTCAHESIEMKSKQSTRALITIPNAGNHNNVSETLHVEPDEVRFQWSA